MASGIKDEGLLEELTDHFLCLYEEALDTADQNTAWNKTLHKMNKNEIQNLETEENYLVNGTPSFPFRKKDRLAGVMPFMLITLFWLLGTVPYHLPSAVVLLAQWLMVALILSFFVMLGIAWTRNFPFWSIPVLFISTSLSVILINMSATPLTGEPGNLGWFAWIPFMLALSIGFVIRPEWGPLKKLYIKLRQEWTLALYGFLALLHMMTVFFFDEVYAWYKLPFVLLMSGLVFLTVHLYFSSGNRKRALGLLLLGTIIFSTLGVLGITYFWEYIFEGFF